MSNMASPPSSPKSLFRRDARTIQRSRTEKRFQFYGLSAIIISIFVLSILFISILSKGSQAFYQSTITLDVTFPEKLDKSGKRSLQALKKVTTFSYTPLIKKALNARIDSAHITHTLSQKTLYAMLSKENAGTLRRMVLENPDLIGTTQKIKLLLNARVDGYLKGRVSRTTAEFDKNISSEQLDLADALIAQNIIKKQWNWRFFTHPDASGQRPEAAGLGVAILGSLYMMLIVLILALPIGVLAAIYLEEFAPKNILTDIIEINISNLAAVPSIVFGILGLAVFINFVGLPQSTPIVGGLVLSLMTLPTIIISSRVAFKAVPPSIRQAALGVGASHMQTVFHHVLPLATPGILTGAIIGLARALGETAPLLLIGMVAFIREFPSPPLEGFFEPASGLPIQIYNWTQRSDPAFIERASGAIIILIIFLLAMNCVAVFLRHKFHRRW